MRLQKMDLLSCPDILSVFDASKVLKLGRTTLYRLINSGEIRCVKVGRKIIIPRIYLQEFLENKTKKCYNIDMLNVGKLPVAGKE